MDKFGKSYVLNLIISAIFIVAGLYLAQVYIMEFPEPELHLEGVVPLCICLVYYIFF